MMVNYLDSGEHGYCWSWDEGKLGQPHLSLSSLYDVVYNQLLSESHGGLGGYHWDGIIEVLSVKHITTIKYLYNFYFDKKTEIQT